MSSLTHILRRISEAPKIDFSDLFNESVAVFKKVWLQGFILQLITIALSLPLVIYNFSVMSESGFDANSYEILKKIFSEDVVDQHLGSQLFIYYILSIVLGIVSSFLSFGFFRVIRQMDIGADFQVSEFFYFFRNGRFTKTLLMILANVGVAVLALLMCVLPIFYVMIPLMFITPIFVYNPELSILEVLKSSFALGHKKWGITFAITLLNILTLYILIILSCGIGALFFSCFLQMPIYILCKKIILFK